MITKYAEILKKLPSPIYKVASQLYIDRKWPRHLFIETTAACNLACDYCPREKVKNHMDFNLFKKIIDEASRYGPRSFSLHLFGEPLLYPKIFEAIDYIKGKNKRNVVLLTTNGTLVERFIDQLTVCPVSKVIWSWRPEVQWSLETIERLRKWGKLTVRMIEEVVPKKERDYWGNWPSVEIRSLHTYGGEISLERFGAKPTVGTRYPCYHLWLAPAVAWNGKFLMCCADPHQKEVFGDINIETVSDSWQRVEKVRQSHLRGEYEGICKNCTTWKSYPDIFFGFQRIQRP